MRRAAIELTVLLAGSIIVWLYTRYAFLFFATLGLCLLFAAYMALYLLERWRWLPGSDRQQGVFALVGWLVMAISVIHINGLSICVYNQRP